MPTSILSIILPAHVFPAVVKRPVLIGALLWTVSIVYFPVQAVVQFASARPYSLLTNLISDLGNTSCGIGPGTAVTTAHPHLVRRSHALHALGKQLPVDRRRNALSPRLNS